MLTKTYNTLVKTEMYDDGEFIKEQFAVDSADINEVATLVYEFITECDQFRWSVPVDIDEMPEYENNYYDLDECIALYHERAIENLEGFDLVEYLNENTNTEIEIGEILTYVNL